MNFDQLISFYEKNATRIGVFGEKPFRSLRVVFYTAGYEFFEEEWIDMDSEIQIEISKHVLREMEKSHFSGV